MNGAGQSARRGALLVLPSMLWLLVFAVLPVLFLVCLSLWTATIFGIEQTWTLANYQTIISDTVYASILLKTLRISAIATLLSLALSYPLAMFLVSLKGRTRSLFLLLMFLPFWSSYVVRSFMWLPVLGKTGLVNQTLLALGITNAPVEWLLFNEGAVYVGLIYVYTLFMVLPIFLSLDRIDPSVIEAARDLGGQPYQIFFRIIWPLSLPGVWSGCVMVFLISVGAYVTPQLLGGASGTMIGNVIAGQFLNTNNWPLGAALSVAL
ncbi:MAG: spermidine/putrescine transport system permease protein, partial [Bradyrhizobium sp.]|nr:spermidine/putrescine transport system permease protein [Bradyrhizobium sp.]